MTKWLAGLAPDERSIMLARLPVSRVQQLLCLLHEVEKDQAVQ